MYEATSVWLILWTVRILQRTRGEKIPAYNLKCVLWEELKKEGNIVDF